MITESSLMLEVDWIMLKVIIDNPIIKPEITTIFFLTMDYTI